MFPDREAIMVMTYMTVNMIVAGDSIFYFVLSFPGDRKIKRRRQYTLFLMWILFFPPRLSILIFVNFRLKICLRIFFNSVKGIQSELCRLDVGLSVLSWFLWRWSSFGAKLQAVKLDMTHVTSCGNGISIEHLTFAEFVVFWLVLPFREKTIFMRVS